MQDSDRFLFRESIQNFALLWFLGHFLAFYIVVDLFVICIFPCVMSIFVLSSNLRFLEHMFSATHIIVSKLVSKS